MKPTRKLLGFLLVSLTLGACKPVPSEISAFLAQASYMNARTKVKALSYVSGLFQYPDAKTFNAAKKDEGSVPVSELVGTEWSMTRYAKKDEDLVAYQQATFYHGSRIKVIADENWEIPELKDQKVRAKTESYTYVKKEKDGKEAYHHEIAYYLAGNDDQAQKPDYVLTKDIPLIDGTYDVWKKIFGDTEFHHNGLYYGSFLAQQTKNFVQFMSVNEDASILTYDPPVTGQDPRLKQYADFRLQVNKWGMVLNSKYDVYDEENDEYSRLKAFGVYEEDNTSHESK